MDRYSPHAKPVTDPGPPLPTEWIGVAGAVAGVLFIIFAMGLNLRMDIVTTATAPPPVLTERQLQILQLIADGRSVNSIGDELHVTPATVKTHLGHIYERLQVTKAAAAVMAAVRHGYLPRPGAAAVVDTTWCQPCNYLGDADGHTCTTQPVRVHIHTGN